MTTANPQQARPDRLSQAWRGFRRWRRSRPFWGGLFTTLAGLEIFSTTQMSLSGLTFQTGPTGFLSWLIPTILVSCGMLMWFSPPQRMFYSIVGAVTAVFSLIGVNLGGFFVGLLLGMVGSALGFAWAPTRQPTPAEVKPEAVAPPDADPEHDDDRATAAEPDEPALIDELLPHRDPHDEVTGPLTDTLPRPCNPLRESSPVDRDADSTPALSAVGSGGRPHRGPYQEAKLLAVTLVLLSVSTAGALGLRDQGPAQAAQPAPCPTPSSTGTKPATPTPSASRPAGETPTTTPSPSPSPSPSPEQTSDGNLITNIIDGVGDFFTGGGDESASGGTQAAGPTADPGSKEGVTPTATITPTGRPTLSGKPTPDGSAPAGRPRPGPPGCATPTPTKPVEVEPGKPLPKIAPEAGQPPVAAKPSKLTGSKVTMTGLRFDGTVELPTDGGTLKALKFSMDKAVTDDFLLQADGPGGKTMRYATDRLTVEGNVAFYATRFVGTLAGIKITLAPGLPFPDGLPITSPIPITFTDPEMQLAYVDCHTLTAKPALKLDLA
ncbi:DUF6114 domain-containing protein [Micromonospora sp. RTGN7]|uniref:DUF6114 domain-containing protein n=1 Tax=Micromonospora sp. RTGN7 TaxID=3016526 RepID=UPI0029FF49D7|nr:DUF6114 domain-containing protein [Micromonospora sp. RTGN7]